MPQSKKSRSSIHLTVPKDKIKNQAYIITKHFKIEQRDHVINWQIWKMTTQAMDQKGMAVNKVGSCCDVTTQ